MTRQISSNARDDLRQQLAEKPDGVIEAIAAQHGLPLQTVVESLPDAMWARVPGTHFVSVMPCARTRPSIVICDALADALAAGQDL